MSRHVTPLGHIILITSQICSYSLKLLRGTAANTNVVFDPNQGSNPTYAVYNIMCNFHIQLLLQVWDIMTSLLVYDQLLQVWDIMTSLLVYDQLLPNISNFVFNFHTNAKLFFMFVCAYSANSDPVLF